LLSAKSTNTEDTDTNRGHGSQLVHGDITNGILSAAYRVHSRLGPGLLERPYRVCLCHELRKQSIFFETEKLLPVEYDGLTVDLGYRIDILVEDAVIVEVKAIETILPVHEAQLLSYLRLSRKRVGLLINFNVEHLKEGIRRRVSGY
jgi:GxxExxY protein